MGTNRRRMHERQPGVASGIRCSDHAKGFPRRIPFTDSCRGFPNEAMWVPHAASARPQRCSPYRMPARGGRLRVDEELMRRGYFEPRGRAPIRTRSSASSPLARDICSKTVLSRLTMVALVRSMRGSATYVTVSDAGVTTARLYHGKAADSPSSRSVASLSVMESIIRTASRSRSSGANDRHDGMRAGTSTVDGVRVGTSLRNRSNASFARIARISLEIGTRAKGSTVSNRASPGLRPSKIQRLSDCVQPPTSIPSGRKTNRRLAANRDEIPA